MSKEALSFDEIDKIFKMKRRKGVLYIARKGMAKRESELLYSMIQVWGPQGMKDFIFENASETIRFQPKNL